MSYASAISRHVARPAPRQKKGFFAGLGSLLDANINTSAYYICFIEVWDKNLGLRKYYWSPIKYLSNWDAMGFASSNAVPTSPFNPTYQMSTLYQWTGDSWQKTSLPRM